MGTMVMCSLENLLGLQFLPESNGELLEGSVTSCIMRITMAAVLRIERRQGRQAQGKQ